MLFGWVATTWMAGASVQAAGVPQDVEVRGSAESTSAQVNPSQPEKKPAKHRFSSVEEEPSFTAQRDRRRWGMYFLQNRREIWTSPASLQCSDTQWIGPQPGEARRVTCTEVTRRR